MLSDFKVAFEKAEEVNGHLSPKRRDNGFIELSQIIDVVKMIAEYDEIKYSFYSFSELEDVSDSKKFGAMLSTQENGDKRVAQIIVNSDNSSKMQRFSLVHELGHLITGATQLKYETPNDGRFTLSSHSNSDITFITDEECENDSFLMAEQIANIFALMVLVPDNITIKALSEVGGEKIASRYGVTSEAIYSRMFLSALKEQN